MGINFKKEPTSLSTCQTRARFRLTAKLTTKEQLNVFEGIQFDESIVKEECHTYLPYGSNAFGYSDEVRIATQNQHLLTVTYNSLIYIEGKLNHRDVLPKTCK